MDIVICNHSKKYLKLNGILDSSYVIDKPAYFKRMKIDEMPDGKTKNFIINKFIIESFRKAISSKRYDRVVYIHDTIDEVFIKNLSEYLNNIMDYRLYLIDIEGDHEDIHSFFDDIIIDEFELRNI